MSAWITWDDVLAQGFSHPTADGIDAVVGAQIGLGLLQPFIDQPRRGPPRVPAWASELVRGLIAQGYSQDSARDVLAWCRAGDLEVRSAAVLSCFDLETRKGAVAQMIYGETRKQGEHE